MTIFKMTSEEIKQLFEKIVETDSKNFNPMIHELFIEQCDESTLYDGKIAFFSYFSSSRHFFDFNMDMTRWMQIDFDQDASYYGQWINPSLLTYISYVEGDVTVIVCDSEESFLKYVNEAKQWGIDNGYGFKIDPGLKPCEYNKKFIENFKGDVH